jgi:hypothetical protein
MSVRRDKNGHTYRNTRESKDARKKNTHRLIKRQCHKNETQERREHEKGKAHTYEKDCHGKFPTKNTQSRNTLS